MVRIQYRPLRRSHVVAPVQKDSRNHAAFLDVPSTAFHLDRGDRHFRRIAIGVRHGHLVPIGVIGPCTHLRIQGYGALCRCRGHVPFTLPGHPET